MIKYEIIVHKPRIPAPWPDSTHNIRPLSPMTQEEYNVYLKDFPFSVGDIVTLTAPNSYMRIGAFARVLEIEPDVNKVEYTAGNKNLPKCMRVLQLSIDAPGKPWDRWDNKSGWRHISQEEFTTLILPVNDKVQDYCLQHA